MTGSQVQTGIAGAAITAGETLYINANVTPQTLLLADADASATTAQLVGIALCNAAIGQPVTYLTNGPITIGATVVVGAIYILSATAGAICPVADLASGMYPVIIGSATTAGIIQVNINIGTVAHA